MRLFIDVAAVPDAQHEHNEGVVFDVDYLGLFTRYRVLLDGGAEMTVVQQNLLKRATDVAAHDGERVRLHWLREHMLELRG